LRARGINSVQLRYCFPREGVQFYKTYDRSVILSAEDWYGDMLRTVQQVAAERFDVIHLWNRTLLHRFPGDVINGMDLPFLRLAGARLAFRFTGYDLRRRSLELKLNRFSPYYYGYASPYSEDDQQRYLDAISPYIDEFVVQDPEMRTYLPGATIIPRAIDLEQFPFPDEEPNQRPKVVHAPSQRKLKGSDLIMKAVEELKGEGLDFDFQLVEDKPHSEALALYRRADIVIDQLLIGWYGVVAMEAMAMGKTTIAYIRDDLVGYFRNGMPLINANPETITTVLRYAIKDRELRHEIGHRGRLFAERVHYSSVVAQAAADMYEGLLNRRAPSARIVPDFSYQLRGSADFRARFEGGRLHASWPRVTELEQEVAGHVARIAQLEERTCGRWSSTHRAIAMLKEASSSSGRSRS
jgi:glycosyltransferase involved in cell wall biosynthesis